MYDEDEDPVVSRLRFLDYRYIRFCFHPLEDKFILCSNWKDPSWTDVKSVRTGLDSDERHKREQVFGKNVIDIQEKSISQLLIDEVCLSYAAILNNILIFSGLPSLLCLPDRQSDTLVSGSVLLLCGLHLCDISCQHHNHGDRYKTGRSGLRSVVHWLMFRLCGAYVKFRASNAILESSAMASVRCDKKTGMQL